MIKVISINLPSKEITMTESKKKKGRAGRPKKTETVDLSRWTVLVPWETRIAVTKAAERDKVSLNEWINRVLNDAARETITGKRDIAKPEDVLDLLQQMAERIDKVAKDMNKPWWKKVIKKD